MNQTANALPAADVLLALAPEELALLLLQALPALVQNGTVHQDAVASALSNQHGHPDEEAKFPAGKRHDIEIALGEAMNWLKVQTLVIPSPGINGTNGYLVISRRGKKLLSDPAAFAQFRHAVAFPKSLLHPAIAETVWLDLARGDLDRAVFTAFKAVEVAVRDAGKFAPTDIGTDLVRLAFRPGAGPLAEKSHPVPEQEALAHLFAGAIGSYKNPHSHRTVAITDPRDAQEMVMLATHLLRIVDARRKT